MVVHWLNDADVWSWLDTEHDSFRITQLELLLQKSRVHSKKTYLQKIADALLLSDYPGDTVSYITPVTNVWSWLLEGELQNSRYRNLCKWVSTYCATPIDDARNYERIARILKIDEPLPIEITNPQNEKTIMLLTNQVAQAVSEPYVPSVFVSSTPIEIMHPIMFMIHDIHQSTMHAISEIVNESSYSDSSSDSETQPKIELIE